MIGQRLITRMNRYAALMTGLLLGSLCATVATQAASVTSAALLLEWDPVTESTKGDPITIDRYVLTWRKAGETNWAIVTIAGTATAYRLAPVTPGESYEMTLSAYTAQNLGSDSDDMAVAIPLEVVVLIPEKAVVRCTRELVLETGTRLVESIPCSQP